MLALHGEEPRLEPLALAFADRFKTYLAKLTYPITRRHAFQYRLRADAGARLGGRARSGAGDDDPRLGDRIASAATATIAGGSRAATNSCRRR